MPAGATPVECFTSVPAGYGSIGARDAGDERTVAGAYSILRREERRTMAVATSETSEWKPKICENVPNISDQSLRWAAQLGIEALALSGRLADPEGKGYWTVEGCQAVADRVRAYGLEVG